MGLIWEDCKRFKIAQAHVYIQPGLFCFLIQSIVIVLFGWIFLWSLKSVLCSKDHWGINRQAHHTYAYLGSYPPIFRLL